MLTTLWQDCWKRLDVQQHSSTGRWQDFTTGVSNAAVYHRFYHLSLYFTLLWWVTLITFSLLQTFIVGVLANVCVTSWLYFINTSFILIYIILYYTIYYDNDLKIYYLISQGFCVAQELGWVSGDVLMSLAMVYVCVFM